MEIIISYLENMFAGLPRTAETERAKRELLDMMEDKYNELKAEGKTENEAVGTVISEFGNLGELAEELGLNKTAVSQDIRRPFSLEEAESYISDSRKTARTIGIGVMMCILSPVLLIILNGIGDGVIGTSNTALFYGLLCLFIFLAGAIALFITSGFRMNKYEFLKTEELNIDHRTVSAIKKASEKFNKPFIIMLTLGVILCVISVVPLLAISLLGSGDQSFVVYGVSIMFLFVATGVFLFINSCVTRESYSVLLQEGDYSDKKTNKKIEKIGEIYWMCVTAVYLLWSFITFNWGITWIIWPISGIIYAVFSTIYKALINQE